MKAVLWGAAAAAAALCSGATAETVRIAGFGGADPVVVNALLNDVMADEIAEAGIEVEYTPVDGDFSQYILNALSAGTAPDLFYTDIFWSDAIIANGLADPVPDAEAAEPMADDLVEAFSREGTLYGVPKDFNTLALFYDLDVFEDAGVEPPSPDDSWAEFEDKLTTVVDELGDVAGICLVPDYARFAAFALATGWEPFDAEGHTTLDGDFRRAFEFYTGLAESGAGVVAADVGEGWMGGCMSSGEAATAMEGAWMVTHIRDAAPSMVYDTTLIPRDPETGERGNLIFTVAWTVNAGSEVKASAHRLAEILTSEKAQQWVLEQGLAIPSREALSDNPWLRGDEPGQVASRMVFEGLSEGNVDPYYFREHGGAWMEPINSALNAVLLGESDVDEALSDAQEALDRITGR